jgi:hypothetical protein
MLHQIGSDGGNIEYNPVGRAYRCRVGGEGEGTAVKWEGTRGVLVVDGGGGVGSEGLVGAVFAG